MTRNLSDKDTCGYDGLIHYLNARLAHTCTQNARHLVNDHRPEAAMRLAEARYFFSARVEPIAGLKF